MQRALAEHRALRRMLQGEWRSSCRSVAAQCDTVARAGAAVDEAVERARRRLRQDARAFEILPLIEALTTEQQRLELAASRLYTQLDGRPAPQGLAIVLSELAKRVRDERPLESAWRRFELERMGFSAIVILFALGAPAFSWWDASFGGAVPTHLAVVGLVQSALPLAALIGWALLMAVWHARVKSWAWLGVRSRGLRVALAAGVLVGTLTACSEVENSTWRSEALLAGALCALCVSTALSLVSSWMRPVTDEKQRPSDFSPSRLNHQR